MSQWASGSGYGVSGVTKMFVFIWSSMSIFTFFFFKVYNFDTEVNILYREVTKLYLIFWIQWSLNIVVLSLRSLRTAQFLTSLLIISKIHQERPHWLIFFFFRWGEVSSVSGFCFGQRFAESWHPIVVRLYWREFCTDGFFLWVDGVYFLYRRCDFMHAGLCVLCFGLSVCWVLTFAAAMLFSSSAVTWLVGCVGIPHWEQNCPLATC